MSPMMAPCSVTKHEEITRGFYLGLSRCLFFEKYPDVYSSILIVCLTCKSWTYVPRVQFFRRDLALCYFTGLKMRLTFRTWSSNILCCWIDDILKLLRSCFTVMESLHVAFSVCFRNSVVARTPPTHHRSVTTSGWSSFENTSCSRYPPSVVATPEILAYPEDRRESPVIIVHKKHPKSR